MLLEIGIGDAYGRPFEFNTLEFVNNNNDAKNYYLRQKETDDLKGVYTDDTQMSIAISEFLLYEDNIFDSIKLSEYFINCFIRDEHPGYSKRITAALSQCIKTPENLINICQTENIINSNGTVMRSVPIGLLQNESLVIRFAQFQSLITHCSVEASNASQLIAITSHYFYYKKHNGDFSKDAFITYLKTVGLYYTYIVCMNTFKEYWVTNQTIPCDAYITCGAIIHTIFESKSISEILINSVGFTGDVDSVAAVSMGIASFKENIRLDYNRNLIYDLENDKYGKNYLLMIDDQLLIKFPRNI